MKIGKYIAGALSGLTFGLLFAPKKGEDLRKEMKKKGDKSKQDAFTVLLDAFKEAGVDALDEAKKLSEGTSIETAVGQSKEKMKEYFAQIEKTGHDIAVRAKEKLDELHDMAVDTTADLKKTAVKKAKVVKKKVVSRSKKAVSDAKKKVSEVKSAAKKSTPKKEKKSTSKAKAKPKKTTSIKTTVKKISKKK